MDIEIRKATRDDAIYVANNLRKPDADEVKASGMPVKDVLLLSFAGSDECYMGLINEKKALIFGVSVPLFGTANIWALGTNVCDEAPLSMVKVGRSVVQDFLSRYPRLENYCAADYEKSIRWLKKLGFTIGDPEPHGVHGELFCKISIEKEQ
jgi:hypothetical protein